MKERWVKDKKFRRNIIIAGMFVLVLLAASCYTVFIKPNLSRETYVYKEETVSRGELVLGIMERGSVTLGESSIEYDLNLELTEDEDEEDEETIRYLEIEEVYAVSGQRIKEGDALFKLTDRSVTAVRRYLKSLLAEAQIALSEAQTEYNISLISAKSTYDASMIAGNRAETDYQAAISGNRQSVAGLEAEIKVLQLEVEQAQEMLIDEDLLESYDDAKTAYTQAKNKYDETDLHNATAYTSNLTAYQEASAALEQIEEQLQGYRDTIADNQEEIERKQKEIETARVNQTINNEEAKNNYESARLEGELAGDIYNYSTESLSETVAVAQNDWDEINEQLEAFEVFVGEKNIICADGDGLVTNIAYSAGDDLITAGSMLTYVKEGEYTVTIDVSEEDIAAIAVGDSVELAFTAYPETPCEGTVISITTSAASDYASTISYPVTIHIEGDTERLYGGMTADVTFVTDSVSDVLYVSRKAVFEEEGENYVYRQSKGDMEKAAVETGFSDGKYIEIKGGLSEGDIIFIKSKINIKESAGETEPAGETLATYNQAGQLERKSEE